MRMIYLFIVALMIDVFTRVEITCGDCEEEFEGTFITGLGKFTIHAMWYHLPNDFFRLFGK